MPTYFVENYAAAGSHCDSAVSTHVNLNDALDSVAARLDRTISTTPDFMPDGDDERSDGVIPADAIPVGAWHASDEELCGGVAIWRTP